MKALLLLALMTTATVSAQSTFDGQNWNGWSEEAKTMYLVGWIDGRSDAAWQVIHLLDEKLYQKGQAALDDPRLRALRRSVTVGQLRVGLNEFYKDYKNLGIGVRTAVSLVRDQLTGANVTEEQLQRIRRIEAERAAERKEEHP